MIKVADIHGAFITRHIIMKIYTDAELAQILNKDIFHKIGEVADEMHVECYLVGGYVRDIFLERPTNDIDVVVVGSGIEVAKALQKRLGRNTRTGEVWQHRGGIRWGTPRELHTRLTQAYRGRWHTGRRPKPPRLHHQRHGSVS